MTAKFMNKFKESKEDFLPSPESVDGSIDFRPEVEVPVELNKETPERSVENKPSELTEASKFQKSVPSQTSAAQVNSLKSEKLIHIESVLEEDLRDVYFKMDEVNKKKFKEMGELTAAKIEEALVKEKNPAKKIFKLIVEWLKVVPGLSKFFIKQEAKIKTDKIINQK